MQCLQHPRAPRLPAGLLATFSASCSTLPCFPACKPPGPHTQSSCFCPNADLLLCCVTTDAPAVHAAEVTQRDLEAVAEQAAQELVKKNGGTSGFWPFKEERQLVSPAQRCVAACVRLSAALPLLPQPQPAAVLLSTAYSFPHSGRQHQSRLAPPCFPPPLPPACCRCLCSRR